MNRWLVLYVALLAGWVVLGMAEPGQANTTKAAVSSLTETGKFADRLTTENMAQPARPVRVVYPSHLTSSK